LHHSPLASVAWLRPCTLRRSLLELSPCTLPPFRRAPATGALSGRRDATGATTHPHCTHTPLLLLPLRMLPSCARVRTDARAHAQTARRWRPMYWSCAGRCCPRLDHSHPNAHHMPSGALAPSEMASGGAIYMPRAGCRAGPPHRLPAACCSATQLWNPVSVRSPPYGPTSLPPLYQRRCGRPGSSSAS